MSKKGRRHVPKWTLCQHAEQLTLQWTDPTHGLRIEKRSRIRLRPILFRI